MDMRTKKIVNFLRTEVFWKEVYLIFAIANKVKHAAGFARDF